MRATRPAACPCTCGADWTRCALHTESLRCLSVTLASGTAGWLMVSRKRPGRSLSCIAALLLSAMAWTGSTWAQTVYKWVDRNGVTQYSSSPPPAGASGVVVPVPPSPSAEAASQAKAAAQRASDEAKRREADRLREQADLRLRPNWSWLDTQSPWITAPTARSRRPAPRRRRSRRTCRPCRCRSSPASPGIRAAWPGRCRRRRCRRSATAA